MRFDNILVTIQLCFLLCVFFLSNNQVKAMEALSSGNNQKIELEGLYGQKLRKLCQSIANNQDLWSLLDKTLIAHIDVDRESVIGIYFCAASYLRDFTHRTSLREEKKRAAYYSAHYLIRSLTLGYKAARVNLIRGYPKAKSLLDNWGPDLVSLDEARFNLLVKIAHDYWVYHKKS